METRAAQEKSAALDSLIQVIRFRLGEEDFAMDILQVEEIIRMMEITKVPKSPDFVEGVINLRDRVIPVVDLRKRFDIPRKDADSQTRIIVLKTRPKRVGIIVDSVSEVLRLPTETVEESPSLVGNIDARCISGVAKIGQSLLMVLDAELILSSTEQKKI
jgi:purine-binding chemotaxis protein CheW